MAASAIHPHKFGHPSVAAPSPGRGLPDTRRTAGVHRYATGRVLAITLLLLAAHLVASLLGDGYWFDEAYMLAIGRHHLDWGSADQPPMAPLLAAVMDRLVPDSILALRIPAILSTAASVPVVALIARELGADRPAQTMTAVAQGGCLWIALTGHWLTPYALEPLQWLALVWLLVRWLRTRNDRLLVGLGLVAGIAAETKFQVFLLCAVLLLGVAVSGPRRLLRRPALWAGVLLALAIAAPTLLWQARHDWPQLRMGPVAAAESGLYGGRPGITVLLLALTGLVGIVLLGYGLWALFVSAELRSYRFLGVTFVVLYVFFVITAGRVYYLSGLYGPFFAVGALTLQRRREAGHHRARWLPWLAYPLTALLAGALVAASIPTASRQAGVQLTARAAAAFETLPTPERSHTVLMGESYIIATYFDVYGEEFSLPPAHSPNRGYGYFDPPADDLHTVVYMGNDVGQLRPWFEQIQQVPDDGEELHVWICTEPRAPWSTIWPTLRNLAVS